MTIEELKEKISVYKIPEEWYSINEGLKNDAYILYKNYSYWEYFYLERGERREYKILKNEEEAYELLWQKLLRNHEVFSR